MMVIPQGILPFNLVKNLVIFILYRNQLRNDGQIRNYARATNKFCAL